MKKKITIKDVVAYGRAGTRYLNEPRVEKSIFDIDEIEVAADLESSKTQVVKQPEQQKAA